MAQYNPLVGSTAQERKRPRIAAMEKPPGPGAYAIPSTTGFKGHDPSRARSPAFSFGYRTKQFSSISTSAKSSPGPVYFVHPSVTKRGKSGTPAYTMYSRLKTRADNRNPGPATYDVTTVPVVATYRPPAFTFGRKLALRDSQKSLLSPASYTLPSLVGKAVTSGRSSPSFTMTGRPRTGGFSDDSRKNPGPADYNVINPTVNEWRAKQTGFSIYPRTPTPEDRSKKPGPGAHSPEKVVCNRPQTPSYSFGIKHSEYIKVI